MFYENSIARLIEDGDQNFQKPKICVKHFIINPSTPSCFYMEIKYGGQLKIAVTLLESYKMRSVT